MVVGLDLSLTGTGVTVLDNDGNVVEMTTIKSKPSGSRNIDELLRINGIVVEILKYISKYEPELIVIENIAFGLRGKTQSLSQLTALNYFVRDMARQYKTPFVLVAPNSNKKYCTGNGSSKKDMMTMFVLKKWGVECGNDNESDAYSLAQIGLALLGYNKDLLKYEEEVLKILKPQLN